MLMPGNFSFRKFMIMYFVYLLLKQGITYFSLLRYEFWVTAHTTIGEGTPSQKATLSPTTRIPAKIASFDDTFVAVAKTDVQLPCIGKSNFLFRMSPL